MAIDLDFGQNYTATQWVGQSSIAQLSQGFVMAYNILVAKEKKTDIDIKLLQMLQPTVKSIKEIYKLCNNYNSEDQFEILNILFYTIPEYPIFRSYKPKTEMGQPSVSVIISALANRFSKLADRYESRTFRGRGWPWFISVIDSVCSIKDILVNQEQEIKDLFIGLSKLKKSFVVKIDREDDNDMTSNDSVEKKWSLVPKSCTLSKLKSEPESKSPKKQNKTMNVTK